VKGGLLLVACGLSSCLLPRVELDQSLNSGGGGAGAPAMSCGTLMPAANDARCCVATGTAADLAIEDLEDGNNAILPIGERQGYWYTYGDSTAKVLPPSDGNSDFPPTAGGHPCSLVPAPPACAGMPGGTGYSAGISGSLMPTTMTAPTYAGLGFDFNSHFLKACPYNAGAYAGISFWAKGNMPLQAQILISATTSPASYTSGTCDGTPATCSNHFSIAVPAGDGTTWKQFLITFPTPGRVLPSTDLAQRTSGTPAVFNAADILTMHFQVNGSSTPESYNFSIDDIAFTR